MTGQTVIIIINESLYYGKKLDHLIINTKQLRSYGISLWENPYDKEKGLNIEVDDNVFINFHTAGTKFFFETMSPTKK